MTISSTKLNSDLECPPVLTAYHKAGIKQSTFLPLLLYLPLKPTNFYPYISITAYSILPSGVNRISLRLAPFLFPSTKETVIVCFPGFSNFNSPIS